MTVRYAVYLAPPTESFLWSFGSHVLGYDAASGAEPAFPDLSGFDAQTWHDLTADPRRYGFHGTLKAPFRLAEGRSEQDLLAAVEALAADHHVFQLAGLEVTTLGAFIALVPSMPLPALSDLAQSAVLDLDPFRAPLSPAEIARRRPEALSARQSDYLSHYGYPYVLEEFRFHMTLTGPLAEDMRPRAFNALSEACAMASAHLPVEIEDVCLYCQETADARFRIVHRAPLKPR